MEGGMVSNSPSRVVSEPSLSDPPVANSSVPCVLVASDTSPADTSDHPLAEATEASAAVGCNNGSGIACALSGKDQETSEPDKSSPTTLVPGDNNEAIKRSRESSPEDDGGGNNSDGERPRKFPCYASSDDEDDNNILRDYLVKPENIQTTCEDIHIETSTMESLENVTLPMSHPEAFSYGILAKCPPPSVLLYGPPGTGKTLVVKAIAKKASAKVLSISGADILDKYVGVGEKKIKNIFQLARKEHPCIIFVDEADSLFRPRSTDGRATNAEYTNEFLVAMDGIKSGSLNDPIVVAATNRPFDIDEGILRRLGKRIMVDLPDAAARMEILRIHLRGESLCDDISLSELAKNTSNYSGSDIRNLVYSAAIIAMREAFDSSPTNGDQGSNQPRPSAKRVLRRIHFLQAKRQNPPAPISDTVAKIREFHNKHGSKMHNGVGQVNKMKPSVIA